MNRLRVMTYNVHSCRGTDGLLMPERILAVLQSSAPDVVALQELDVGQTRSRALDQAAFLADGLRMEFQFVAARACHGGHYGNAILSRLPIVSARSAALPQLHDRCEPRAIQHVRVSGAAGAIDVLNVHFGLSRQERRLQVESLLGPEWLGSGDLGDEVVLCGDFNAAPGSYVYRRLARGLSDTQRGWGRATFPSVFPVVRLDYVFVSPRFSVLKLDVVSTRLARLASDHRPLVVDLSRSEPA